MGKKSRVLIKIGGKAAAAESSLRDLIREMAALRDRHEFILVHGGGAEVSRVTRIFGLEPVFRDGVRMTSPPEMEIVDMVLSGKVNKDLVRMFSASGIRAVGISGSDGGFFTGRSIDPAGVSRTGRVERVDPEPVLLLLKAGYLPVAASTSMDPQGGALNINADEAALEIAKALAADALVFLSDIPGILKDSATLRSLDRAAAEREIRDGVITGGMIPKVTSSLEALHSGVRAVVIGEFTTYGDLALLLSREKGTTIGE